MQLIDFINSDQVANQGGKCPLRNWASERIKSHDPINKHALWKRLSMRSVLSTPLKTVSGKVREMQQSVVAEGVAQLVFVDGVFSSEQSALNDHITVSMHPYNVRGVEKDWESFLKSLPQNEVAAAMTTMLTEQITCIAIAQTTQVEIVHQITKSQGVIAMNFKLDVAANVQVGYSQKIVTLNKDAEVAILVNRQVCLNHSSMLSDCFVDQVPSKLSYLQSQRVLCDERAQYENTHMVLGGRAIRHLHQVELNGQRAQSRFYGIALASDKERYDQTIQMQHNASHTQSEQQVKNVARQNSLTNFTSRVYVKEGVSAIESEQLNHNLLMDDTARALTSPELEIYADEVRCAHGATVGTVDTKALFYLRSRGLNKKQAEALLIRGFVSDTIEKFPSHARREAMAVAKRYLAEIA